MKPRNARHHLLSAVALIFISATRLLAFTSTQKAPPVTCGAFVGGPATGGPGLKIHHDQLPAGSLVTKQFIIIGEAGDQTPIPPPPLSARLNPASDFGPIANRKIRITIEYRFLTEEQAQGLVPAPDPSTLPVVEGPDPTSFAFQIPGSSFTAAAPVLQYRIIAQRLSFVGGVQSVIATTTDPATAGNNVAWIQLNAVANAANVIGAQGGSLVLPDGNPLDGESAIDIPEGAFSDTSRVTLDEVPSNSSLISNPYPGAVRYYEATSDGVLNNPGQITLLYPDFEFPLGANGIVDGTNISVQTLTIYEWDGFTWRRLGGVVNTQNNTIQARIPFFGLFAVAVAQSLNLAGTGALPASASDHRPQEKIITPNGDGANRVATFSVDNLTQDYKIDIYDINGRRVKTINTGSSLTWDGRDDSGRVVESGVYIYQYTIDGKLISGFIAVAK